MFLYVYYSTQVSILDCHCPGTKQEVGTCKRNSSQFLPLFNTGNAFCWELTHPPSQIRPRLKYGPLSHKPLSPQKGLK